MKAVKTPELLLIVLVATAHADSQPWDDPEGWTQKHEGGHRYQETEDKIIKAKLADILADSEGLGAAKQ